MPIDASEPRSPSAWLLKLGPRLDEQRHRCARLRAYNVGDHPLPTGNPKWASTYRALQRMSRSNYVGLVASTVAERMTVTGFRAGGDADAEADRETWSWWQSQQLDADSGLVHGDSLVCSVSYVTVGAPGEDGRATATAEDPASLIHAVDPQRRRLVTAALKLYTDDWDAGVRAVVYLPDGFAYFRSTIADPSKVSWSDTAWEVDDTPDHPDGWRENPLGRVPVVPFVNRPDTRGRGMGEFEDVLDIQDRINKTLLDRMVIAAMQAFRQRWAKGITLTDEQGNDVEPFIPGADLLWAVEDEKAEFGDFEQAALGPLLEAARSDMRDLAAISRTPPHYLTGELTNVNGETLKAAETGLIAKVRDRQREAGESWESVAALAAAYEGRALPADAEVIWADPESRSMAEVADAAVKKQAIGVPWRQLMEDLGYSPPQIDRMESARAVDALFALPPAPTTTGV